jgi:hypothetical protein
MWSRDADAAIIITMHACVCKATTGKSYHVLYLEERYRRKTCQVYL